MTTIYQLVSEKKIVLTVVLIIVVLFISIVPYLMVNNLEEQCPQEEANGVRDELGFIITKWLSVPMFCISCAVNPFLYAWRIPQYRQALRSVWRTACVMYGSDDAPEQMGRHGMSSPQQSPL